MPDHPELPAAVPNHPHESVSASRSPRATLSLAAGRGETRVRLTRPGVVAATNAVDTVPLKHLTAGRKALKIAHAGETYLLQITKANKLILTKPALAEIAEKV